VAATQLEDLPVRDHTTRTEANARLTSLAGMVLFVGLAVEGVTILAIHRLVTAHVVVGLAMLGPLVVKLVSVGWRFLRYYRGDAEYGRAGAPRPLLRILAPVLVVSTLAVFASGIGLLIGAPGRQSTLLGIHKVSFFVWFGVTTIHVLAYLGPAVRRSWADLSGLGSAAVLATRRTRALVLGAGVVAGIALGFAGLDWAHSWATWLGTRSGH
jgi:hypothetical protein